MIGHVSIGKSFYHLIRYVLEDKKELSEQQKKLLSEAHNLQHTGRAEVLEYNKCFGDIKELTEQFRDVQKLSRRIEKPVLHLSLRLAPGEQLSRAQFAEIGRACAEEFGVADNQYICVLHKDTKEPHIHIAANRVGFDGKVASDSNSYKRMASLCRRLEKQYGLQEVLSPKKFLPAAERNLPRNDKRKEKMREDISNILNRVTGYPAFEKQMKDLGYQLIKGRGISFIDDKKVKVKGSEIGFSLAKIERILSIRQQLETAAKKQMSLGSASYPPKAAMIQNEQPIQRDNTVTSVPALSGLLEELLKPEYGADYINPELLREAGRKKKKPKLKP
ncbi:hypothetical protein GCM10009120_07730 [Sphingobacterium siyangense subsp. cladoniae]|uniref:relaxase/mobilization nuclease domain-containing protein n=1 Tax=Sphingobacterium siyangense TaxID=459529 RepID=UPI0031F8A7C7